MEIRKTRLKLRRVFKKRRKQVALVSESTDSGIERYVFKRLIRLVGVQRFVFGWLGLAVLLILGVVLQTRALSSHYQQVMPVAGGTLREGIVGTFTNANPLYAQNSVDGAVSRIVFSGLLKYDKSGEIVPDLAREVSVDDTESVYTVRLKDNVYWHDGKPITSEDVAFTFNTIKNPDARSYLISGWKNITITIIDEKTISFTLPTALSGFNQSLTTGIIPKHILDEVPVSQLRASSFNNELPIGSGPFAFKTVEVEGLADNKSERIAFVANTQYHLGTPKLERIIIRTYSNADKLVQAFQNKEVDTMSGLSAPPEDIDESRSEQYDIPVTSQVMVFFKTTQETLKDPVIRKALVLSANKSEIFERLDYPLKPVDQPLLKSQIGYDKTYAQITNNQTEANALLDSAGWVRDPVTKTRSKDGKKLGFKLFSASTSEFTSVSGVLQKQWRDLGVEVEVVLQSDEELQASVTTHNYDALLYGISLGLDPDVYPYWHSTQFDPRAETRLNLSEYSSPTADRALEAGRTRSDEALRSIKYRPFLESWQKDTPALALYQPRYLYIANNSLRGFEPKVVHSQADRYSEVHKWTVRRAPQSQ